MNQSDICLLDLPDEILLTILKKLDNIDVLYSLLDIDNNRLDTIAQDRAFTTTLNLMSTSLTDNISSIDESIMNRFCIDILPRIHHNIKYLIFESSAMERIFLAGDYPNLNEIKLFNFRQDIVSRFFKDESLIGHIFHEQITDLTFMNNGGDSVTTSSKDYTTNVYAHILTFFKNLRHLSIIGSSIAAYPGLSLCELPSTTFSSSILTKLSINVPTFDDCLYLLDGRLNQLTTFIVRIYDIDFPSSIIHNTDNLITLKSFSLTCHSHIRTYDNRVVPLLRRMSSLKELTLCLTVRNRNGLIDGIHLQNGILVYMPLLNTFTFDIRTWNEIDDIDHCLSNDDIQQTFVNIVYRQVGCSIRYFPSNSVLCHVFTTPFTFDYLQCITNNSPIVSFKHVRYLSVCDILPFEHEFFTRINQAIPLLKHLTVTNSTPQASEMPKDNDNNQSGSIIKYQYLTYLSVMNSDITYTEQFLLETKTHLPQLTDFRVNYYQLKMITENFTRDTTRLNCSKVERLITDEILFIRSNDFCLYFPLL